MECDNGEHSILEHSSPVEDGPESLTSGNESDTLASK